jgi:hypothetical protein
MTTCLFVGPTLKRQDVLDVCDAICLPPAAQGDVYRAARQRPKAIGIIDGYFSGAPSVWHKEILWALSEGIHVFGSASMGALRAAELHRFGMRGVGSIFEAFRDGVLEDDDEVAVAHGPAETDFVPVSEPMVNIRATLARAETERVLCAASRERIGSLAKSIFFPGRMWPAIFEAARAAGVAEAELDALVRWLPQGRVDQKRADALAMLHVMRETVAGGEPHRPCFSFESTYLWARLVEDADRDSGVPDDVGEVSRRLVLDELRLEGAERYREVRTRALLRVLGELEARRRGLSVSPQQARAKLGQMRAARAFFSRAELEAWLARNNLDSASFERLVREEASLDIIEATLSVEIESRLLDELRLSENYERLLGRAKEKQTILMQSAPPIQTESAPGIARLERRLWYFQHRLGRAPPDDMEAWARESGFDGPSEFDTVLAKEWLFVRLAE